MSKFRSFVVNTVWMYASEGVGRLCGFLLMVAIVRELGLGALGEYSLATSVAMIVGVLSDLGTTLYLIQKATGIPDEERDLTFHAVVVLRLVLAAAAFLLFLAWVPWSGLPAVTRQLVTLLVLSSVVGTVTSVYSNAFRIRERLAAEGALRAASAVLTLGIAWSLMRSSGILVLGWTILGVAVLMAGTHVLVVYSGRYVSLPSGRAVPPEMRRVLQGLSPFAAYAVLDILYQRSDFLMLFYLGGPEPLGAYAAAYRLFEAAILLPVMVGTALVPAFSRLQKQAPERLEGYVRTTARLFATLAFPVAALGVLYGEPILALLLGGDQRETARVLQILACTLVPVYLRALYVFAYISGERAFEATRALALQLAVNVILNLLLIPRFGATGAAGATLAAEVANVLYSSHLFARSYFRLSPAGVSWRPLLACLPAAGAAWTLPPILGAPAFLALYLPLVALLGGVTRADLDLARLLVRSRSTTP